MSKEAAVIARSPWENRWTAPTRDALLGPLNVQHRRIVDTFLDACDGLDQTSVAFTWYGPSWNWTFEFHVHGPQNADLGVLCYVVPRHAGPLICVPLTDQEIEQLPIRRLNKVIRDGIKSAKSAISNHWAMWTPTTLAETQHILDLVSRKHGMMTEAPRK